MATSGKSKSTSSRVKERAKTGRAKPLVHTPGLTKSRRRFGYGGNLSKKKSS